MFQKSEIWRWLTWYFIYLFIFYQRTLHWIKYNRFTFKKTDIGKCIFVLPFFSVSENKRNKIAFNFSKIYNTIPGSLIQQLCVVRSLSFMFPATKEQLLSVFKKNYNLKYHVQLIETDWHFFFHVFFSKCV